MLGSPIKDGTIVVQRPPPHPKVARVEWEGGGGERGLRIVFYFSFISSLSRENED